MKKTLVTAITTALVVGAASTTFAAANPFSDVPADHWAYDAVTTLAKDGVVEGYGDGTYRGNQNITRYEMAQIVAKAMAKDNVSAADKATIDKLAAEFADELNNLGVRVSNLEKKSDNVKFTGLLRAETLKANTEGAAARKQDNLKFRLEPTAQLNSDWIVKARLDWTFDPSTDSNSGSTSNGVRAWAQGPIFGKSATLIAGKFPLYTSQGVIADTDFSGAAVTFGNELKTTLIGGRWAMDTALPSLSYASLGGTATVAAAQFDYVPANSKMTLTAGYYDIQNKTALNSLTNNDGIKDWSAGGTYKFDNNYAFNGLYVKNTSDDVANKDQYKAYNAQLTYKGVSAAKPGSFQISAAYRYLGEVTVLAPTFDNNTLAGKKGYEIGTKYAIDKNIVLEANYFDGKLISSDKDTTEAYGKVEFFF